MYSTSQMDNFYDALSKGIVKSSGIMNYIQHFYIAKNVPSSSSILEVCCGRCLLIPLLDKYATNISYVGIDISDNNLEEAKKFIGKFDIKFPVELRQLDVTTIGDKFDKLFDIIVYTSSIEHMSKDNGIKSLNEVFKLLKEDGTLFLSSPRTPKQTPNILQYKVHIYEWDLEELLEELNKCGFQLIDKIGLLSQDSEVLLSEAESNYGTGVRKYISDLLLKVPFDFAEPILASVFPNAAREILYICKK